MSAFEALTQLWQQLNLNNDALDRVKLTGSEPILPSSFHVGVAAQASLGAATLAVSEIDRLRNQRQQGVSVDMRHALAEFRSERLLNLLDAKSAPLWDPLAGLYQTADGWVRVHTNFDHHKQRLLAMVGTPMNVVRSDLEAIMKQHKSADLEDQAAECGAIVSNYRTRAQWLAHPASVVRSEPLISLTKIHDSAPIPLTDSNLPLSGLNVLDLTRIIAGPVSTRFLAAYDANVLRIDSQNLPWVPAAAQDTLRGKRSAFLDLATSDGQKQLTGLLTQTDVFVQAYRPGSLSNLGFGPEQCVKQKPGLIYASLCAYGFTSPWADRRGFDSIVQTATGINWLEATAAGQQQPRPLPCQCLDHGSGYLLALGILAALYRRATEGGSWHVKVSLARTGEWLNDLGRSPDSIHIAEQNPKNVDLLKVYQTAFGRVEAVRPAGLLSQTAPDWTRPTPHVGQDEPRWSA